MYKIVGSDGREYGPVEKEALIQWAREGRVIASTIVIDAATGQRFPAGQMPDLAALFNTGPPPGAPDTYVPPGAQPGAPYGTYGASPYGQPYGSPYGGQGSPYGSQYNPFPNQPAASPPATGAMIAVSIVLTLLTFCTCCIPFGLPSLIYAFMASSKVPRGDYMGAERDLAQARMWAWIAFGIWLVGIVIGLIGWVGNPRAFNRYSPYGGF